MKAAQCRVQDLGLRAQCLVVRIYDSGFGKAIRIVGGGQPMKPHQAPKCLGHNMLLRVAFRNKAAASW